MIRTTFNFTVTGDNIEDLRSLAESRVRKFLGLNDDDDIYSKVVLEMEAEESVFEESADHKVQVIKYEATVVGRVK